MSKIWNFFIGVLIVIGLIFIGFIVMVMMWVAFVIVAIKEFFRSLK